MAGKPCGSVPGLGGVFLLCDLFGISDSSFDTISMPVSGLLTLFFFNLSDAFLCFVFSKNLVPRKSCETGQGASVYISYRLTRERFAFSLSKYVLFMSFVELLEIILQTTQLFTLKCSGKYLLGGTFSYITRTQ